MNTDLHITNKILDFILTVILPRLHLLHKTCNLALTSFVWIVVHNSIKEVNSNFDSNSSVLNLYLLVLHISKTSDQNIIYFWSDNFTQK